MIFFGTDTQRERAMVMHHGRFNFMREARIRYSRDPEQETLPGSFENEVVLSDEFYREILDHPFRRIWKPRWHSRVHRPHWICSCGSPIAVSLLKERSASLFSVISGWRISWAAPSMLARVDSESGWISG